MLTRGLLVAALQGLTGRVVEEQSGRPEVKLDPVSLAP